MESWRRARIPALPGRGSEPRIRDTATGELAVAAQRLLASVYACGITPYDSTHIGHAATFTAWDLLVRALLDAGHHVRYVQNVTDVDDPLLERADRDGEDWRHLADREIGRYRADMAALRILPPDRLVGAVEAMPLIEEFTARLAERGALYELDADLYFPRSADARFGSLSGLGTEDMLALSAERGGDPGRPGKKDPLDVVVWRGARPGEPAWESAFGPGRPGWHVECAAIATHYLGDIFDLQVGGSDLVFPHHEMSASHARVALGGRGSAAQAFARRYAHSGMVGLNGEKMSKSLGNLVFVSDLLAAGSEAASVRLALLAHRYRDDWDWTQAGLDAARRRLDRWRAAVLAAGTADDGPAAVLARGAADDGPAAVLARGAADDGPAAVLARGAADDGPAGPAAVLAGIRERLADDLDAPGALAVVDAWADAVLAGRADVAGAGPAGYGGAFPRGGALVRDGVDALLGVAM